MVVRNGSSSGVLSEEQLDFLLSSCEEPGDILGPNGFLTRIVSQVLNRALDVELADHLGYDRGEKPVGNNFRNGYIPKTLKTEVGEVPIRTPRDRDGTFEPVMVPKHSRRLDGFTDLICGLLSRGMSTRDICAQLADTYGVHMTPSQVSDISDAVNPLIDEWRLRPLDSMYPIVYLDAMYLKVRTDGRVVSRPCYLALGVTLKGEKEVLGMWLGDGNGESAKFWLTVCTELHQRGLQDIIITCTDGLKGFDEAIKNVWPQTTTQTCVVHLLRNCFKFVTKNDRATIAAALKPIYTAINATKAETELNKFETEWGHKYASIVNVWRRNWDRFIPFLEFPPDIGKIIYTTNAIESLNYQLRKSTKTRGSFPTEQAAYKQLYLAITNINPARKGHIATQTLGWTQALNAFALQYPNRIEQHLK